MLFWTGSGPWAHQARINRMSRGESTGPNLRPHIEWMLTAFVELLLGFGYRDGADLHHLYVPSAPHNESAWRARLPGALDSLVALGWGAPDDR